MASESERARRLERAGKFAVENGWASEDDPVVNDLAKFAASEVSAAVQAERLECAKVFCPICKTSSHPLVKHKGKWMHHITGKSGYYTCMAAVIHERGSRSE